MRNSLGPVAPRCHTVEVVFPAWTCWRYPLRAHSWTPLMQSKASLWSAIKSFHNPSQGLSTPRDPNLELSTNSPGAWNFHNMIFWPFFFFSPLFFRFPLVLIFSTIKAVEMIFAQKVVREMAQSIISAALQRAIYFNKLFL